MTKQLDKVNHNYIRYANCWEDADLLIEGLQVQQGDSVLSIGSAGDNSFSLLVNNPKIVVAVDINEIQLNLIELKKAAFKTLNYISFLEFLGFRISSDRGSLFNKVKQELSPELQYFWESRIEEIEAGVIFQGKFERYFELFRKRILPWIHSKKKINQLFESKTEEEQISFHDKKWNNWRWRLLFKLFFSKFVMGKIGRDPEFLKQVDVKVSDFILGKASQHLRSQGCQKNYFLQLIMKGEFGDYLPHYARKENFDLIKQNIENLHVFKGLAEDAFNNFEGFNKFNLSNIFEYMSESLFESVAESFYQNSAIKSRFCYWNLMVPRYISSVKKNMKYNKGKSKELTNIDKGFFYANFIIDLKND